LPSKTNRFDKLAVPGNRNLPNTITGRVDNDLLLNCLSHGRSEIDHRGESGESIGNDFVFRVNEAAREFVLVDLNDPRRTAILEELCLLTLRRALIFGSQRVANQWMDELAREMTMLKPGDPRRAQIVEEIMRPGDALKQA